MVGCGKCDGQGWVCENHADKPWGGMSERDDACSCGAGMPCKCNRRDAKTPPEMPGSTIVFDQRGWIN